MEINIEELLLRHKKDDVLYVPNPGNGGDSLIAGGTYQLFDEIGLRYRIVSRDLPEYPGAVVIYSGGGNLGLMKNFSARFLQRIHRTVGRLIILPHTIKDVSPLLQDFGENVDIVCRERVSYDYVRSTVRHANVYLADDMALRLKPAALFESPPSLSEKFRVFSDYVAGKLKIGNVQAPSLFALGRLMQANKLLREMRSTASGTVLHAYRTDSEKTDIELPADNVDVSEILTMGAETKELALINSYYFLSFLNDFDLIRTNRLHVCIGGVLLGKQVEFHSNSYYKCKAVYEYSLRGYENLKFAG